MKKIFSVVFLAAIVMTSWSALKTSKTASTQNLFSSIATVEALTEFEVTITCSSGNCGQCFIWSNSGRCIYSGYTVDYCEC